MYSFFRGICERVLKIPHDPVPPEVDAANSQTFRAAPAYYKYRVVVWLIGTFALFFFIVVFLGGLNAALITDRSIPSVVQVVVPTVSLVVFLLLVAHSLFSLAVLRLDYEKRWYLVTDRSLRVREGVMTVREMTVSFANIQNVSVTQGPIQRLLGLADVRVETAGGGAVHTNQKQVGLNLHIAWFRGIDNAEEVRTLIQDRLRKLKDAGLGDHDDHPLSVLPVTDTSSAILEALRAVHAEAGALRSATAGVP